MHHIGNMSYSLPYSERWEWSGRRQSDRNWTVVERHLWTEKWIKMHG